MGGISTVRFDDITHLNELGRKVKQIMVMGV